MKLHEIQSLLPQPCQGSIDDGFAINAIHRLKVGQVRNEFGMYLYSFRVCRIRPAEATDEKFDTGINICAIEGGNPRVDEGCHVPSRLIRVDDSMITGKVPAAFDDA